MSIKKKLGLGAMSAVMGLSLVGVGTWAAFNDVENVNASVAAGELDLLLSELNGQPYTFDVSNLKPGDTMERSLRFVNDGSLAIKDVLLSIDKIDFDDYLEGDDPDTYGENTAIEYLSQFKVKVVSVGDQGGDAYPIDIIVEDITLADLYLATTDDVVDSTVQSAARTTLQSNVKPGYYYENRLNFLPMAGSYTSPSNAQAYAGLPVGVVHNLKMIIEFDNDETKVGGLHVQNKYQGDIANVIFTLEARQWDGQEVTENDMDDSGYVETNEDANNGDTF